MSESNGEPSAAESESILPSPAAEAPTRTIAGFWRRVGGVVLDWLILAMPTFMLGAAIFNVLADLGPWCLLIGFGIVLVYHGIGNSRVTGGRTPGKAALGTRVVDRDGIPLSIRAAVVRTGLLWSPIYVPGLVRIILPSGNWIEVVIGLAASFAGLCILYLLVFNAKTRQSLHDFVVGSYVVLARSEGKPYPHRAWRGHFVLAGVGALAVAALGFAGIQALMNAMGIDESDMQAMQALQTELMEEFPVHAAGVELQQNWHSQQGTQRLAVVTVHWSRPFEDIQADADKVARMVFERFEAAREQDAIVIQLVRSFTFGYAYLTLTQHAVYDPAQFEPII